MELLDVFLFAVGMTSTYIEKIGGVFSLDFACVCDVRTCMDVCCDE